jgi:hypothetical protein
MTSDEIRELLSKDPFEPFRVRLSSGDAYEVRDSQSVAVMKTRMFIALSGGGESVFVPFLHVAAVESLGNGRHRRPPRRR